MKHLLTFAILTVALCATAETAVSPDFLALLEAKYQRDQSNQTGRAFWHGKLLSTIADPSNLVTVTVYEDGKRFTDRAPVITPKKSVDAANAKLKRTVNKQGIPQKLAEARARRAAEVEQGVSNVTVTVRAGQ